jgi:hypothetical protein
MTAQTPLFCVVLKDGDRWQVLGSNKRPLMRVTLPEYRTSAWR